MFVGHGRKKRHDRAEVTQRIPATRADSHASTVPVRNVPVKSASSQGNPRMIGCGFALAGPLSRFVNLHSAELQKALNRVTRIADRPLGFPHFREVVLDVPMWLFGFDVMGVDRLRRLAARNYLPPSASYSGI
jgi:hypothetical protein